MRGINPASLPAAIPCSFSVNVLPAPVCPYAINVPLYLPIRWQEWWPLRSGTGRSWAFHPLRTDCTSGRPSLAYRASLSSLSYTAWNLYLPD